jgi:hypothetical protein
VKMPFMGSIYSDAFPRGCEESESQVHLNLHPVGGVSSIDRPLCKAGAPQFTPDVRARGRDGPAAERLSYAACMQACVQACVSARPWLPRSSCVPSSMPPLLSLPCFLHSIAPSLPRSLRHAFRLL